MELPPRLSDSQQFILACVADGHVPATELSYHVAREFEGFHDRTAMLADADPEAIQVLSVIVSSFDSDEVLTATHRSSFSRSVRRLSERELVTRLYRAYKLDRGEDPNMSSVEPTEQGRAVGEELRRRHSDGRYSLRFDSVPWNVE
jgi:hypothetical protein